MASTGIVLTISIPTYNRAFYLDRCLNNIAQQYSDVKNSIELIVSDNASTDNTQDIVKKHIEQGLLITYYRNEKNMGPDYNIYQCYAKANGSYVLTLGDDDIIINGGLKKIIQLCERNEFGVIELSVAPFNDANDMPNAQSTSSGGFLVYDSAFRFLKKINFNITFISGNVVKKEYFNADHIMEHMGSYLIQVHFFLSAIYFSKKNCYLLDKVIGAQNDNSGGYSLVNVFSKNLNTILTNFEKRYSLNDLKSTIAGNLLIGYFPQYILAARKKNPQHNWSADTRVMIDENRSYLSFWLLVYPILKLPLPLAKIYFIFTRLIRKITFVTASFFNNGQKQQFSN